MSNTERFPVDYESLQKGDVIPAERIEQITGFKRHHPRYSLASTNLASRIQRDLHSIGKTVTVACRKGDIVILTDAEASTYNHKGVLRHRRGMLRRHFLDMAVDASNLTNDQKQDHERYIEVDGRLIQAIRSVDYRPRLKPVERTVPGLPA